MTAATDCTTASTDDLMVGYIPWTSLLQYCLSRHDITQPSPRRSPDAQTVIPSRDGCLDMLLDLTARRGCDKLVK
ncbi:hypothetical protein PoB_006496400 [Plakobranchus ocellatus]|uniref:Uncharacterized protein n=1 Tax=Plakobranchus ocellatus TaxID=259542 RepID=A0AAV4D2R9_9GAST|nr:hypothetical protein PoB_006496400 [Plakobranchus ocellatus]